ncbi:MAG: hypothetical protein MJ252_02390 [archaeon]|nr:hypothetical protein [archaeon]
MNVCAKWETMIIVESCECLAKYNTVIAKRKNGHIWILGGNTKFNTQFEVLSSREFKPSEANRYTINEKDLDPFSVVDVDFNAKIIRPFLLKNNFQNIFNNFQYMRIGVEGINDCVYFFEENPNKAYANIYKIDEFTEKRIRISQGVDVPQYSKTMETEVS